MMEQRGQAATTRTITISLNGLPEGNYATSGILDASDGTLDPKDHYPSDALLVIRDVKVTFAVIAIPNLMGPDLYIAAAGGSPLALPDGVSSTPATGTFASVNSLANWSRQQVTPTWEGGKSYTVHSWTLSGFPRWFGICVVHPFNPAVSTWAATGISVTITPFWRIWTPA